MTNLSGSPVVILGATSAIGREIAEVLSDRGKSLVLYARNIAECEEMARELGARHGISAIARRLDVNAFAEEGLRRELEPMVPMAGVILCVGYLGDNIKAAADPSEAARIMDTNFIGSARALDVAASMLSGGFVCALSSVAADRPRRKVHTYGLAKQALNTYLSQLRRRLAPRGVRVITVKLGSVDTKMIAHKRRHPLVVSARSAAVAIVDACLTADGVVYIPAKWKYIMLGMRIVPERIYRRL
ncbi:MAG TPA: SDR family NAD(P)-dependent oxidoreductase [Gemmatimonadaceae bacterium]